jgi:hypothetical protein
MHGMQNVTRSKPRNSTAVMSHDRRLSVGVPDGHVQGASDQAAVCVLSMDQPTTRRDQISSTTVQYTLPSLVGCSVMSVTHS